MALDPNNLNSSKINLNRRISQPLRSVLSTGKRMMSNGKFIKSMRTALSGNKGDGITDKMAKKMALHLAVGVKDLGVTFKKEKNFFNKMKDEGMLSTMYKRSVKNAITHYKTLAGAAVNDNKEIAANDNVEIDARAENNMDKHHREQKIRDEIEQQKRDKQDHEDSATQNFGRSDVTNAVTSVEHLVHKPDTSAKLAGPLPPEDPLIPSNTQGPVQLD